MSSSIPYTSGIYKITCLPTGKVYIGSATNIEKRWRSHRNLLLRGAHENPYLQRAWDKHGESSFAFEVLELILASFLTEREQYWIDTLRTCDRRRGFNISIKAGAPMTGRKHTPESRAKMARSQLGRKHTEETKRMMSERNKGKIFGVQTEESRRKRAEWGRGRVHSAETRAKMSQAQLANKAVTRAYIVTTPGGIELEIENLRRFCREHDLSANCMLRVARGYNRQHRGYICRYPDGVVVTPPKPRKKEDRPDGRRNNRPSAAAHAASIARQAKAFVLTDPDGVEHHIVNLTAFCRGRGLDAASFYPVLRGECRQYKGWTCRYANRD